MPPHLIGWPKRGVFGGRWSPCFYFGWIIIPLEVAVIVVAFKPPSLGVGTDENYIHFSTIMKTNLAFLAIQDCDDLAVQILPLSHFSCLWTERAESDGSSLARTDTKHL